MNLNDVSKNFFFFNSRWGFTNCFRCCTRVLKKEERQCLGFIGDMTYETGGFYECYKYSKNFNLLIKFVVEDNEMSTNTKTSIAWGKNKKISMA